MTPLLAISPLDGRYAPQTAPLQDYFSEFALFKFRFLVETEWFITLSQKVQPLSAPAIKLLRQKCKDFNIKDAEAIKKIEAECKHDVKAVEYYLKAFLSRHKTLKPYQEWAHFGCTSEDINNLAYGLMIKSTLHNILLPKLEELTQHLVEKAHQYAKLPMLARTHGQAATPTTLGKEFANVAYRLQRQIKALTSRPILGKFNGAVGNYNAQRVAMPSIDWPSFNQRFVEGLGLSWNPYTTQIEPHDYLAEILHTFAQVNTVLIDLSRDCWSYISLGYFVQQANAKEVGSSTMPHKINPIDFENAEGNLSLSQSLAQFLASRLPISRYQRDLVDSTLMRNVGVTFAYTLIAYEALLRGLNKISADKKIIEEDLMQHPEVLAEAIQTIMRAHGLSEPYEKLKAFTRGQKITQKMLHDFIQTLSLPVAVKKQLMRLKPTDYLGYAEKLSRMV